MDSYSVIKIQNRIVVKLLWICAVLAFINNILTVQDIKAGILILVCCGGFALLLSYFIYKNKMVEKAKYMAIAGIFLTSFIFIQFTPGFLSYMTIYIAIVILSIYQNVKVIIASGIIGFALSTYSFLVFKDMIFNPRYESYLSMISINFFIVMFCYLLILQIKFGSKLFHNQ